MRHLLFFAGVALAASVVTTEATAEIGVLAAVNRDMTGARPSEAARPLFIREKLVQNERITSTAGGGGQVLFLDQTSLTIAPNSEVVLDRYVYDPDTQTGDVAVTVLQGAMRFVGGRISKTNAATITTPTATIGIRGGMGNVNVQAGVDTTYIHVAGISSTITTETDSLTITREGGIARIGLDGALEYLGVATDDLIAGAFRSGTAGQGDGGSAAGGSEGAVNNAVATVEAEVSGDADIVTQSSISTSGERQSTGFAELSIDVDAEDTGKVSEITQEAMVDEDPDPMEDMMDDMVNTPTGELDSFLATGVFDSLVQSDGSPINAPGSAFQLIFSTTSGEGAFLFALPDTGDTLANIDLDDSGIGIGDQFLVQLQGDDTLTGDTGLSTSLGGDPSQSTFTVNETTSTLSGSLSVDYANSPLVTLLETVEGQIEPTALLFIGDVASQEGETIDTLQTDLDIALDEFRAALEQGQ